MKIAVFNSHTLLASHYETELEIIINHLNAGDSVVQIVCDKDLPACDTNPFHLPEACERCVSKRKNGLQHLGLNVKAVNFFNLTESDKQRIQAVPKKYTSIADLQKLVVDNYEVGFAVSSSLISYYRNANPDLDQKLIERYIVGCLGVYFSMINYLKAHPTDVVYAFNGRLSHTKAVLQACKIMGVLCRLHERGNSLNYYSIFDNTSIHDLKNTQKLIDESWTKAPAETKVDRATKWFTTRIGGKMENWYSFLENQVHELPPEWDESKNNVILCTSSEDEFASLGDEWKNHLYASQTDGIFKIIESVKAIDNLHLYIRIHPHLAKVDNDDLRRLIQAKGDNLTIIPAQSQLSTYTLVKHGTRVITFGSTIGMESTFLRKPSILAGKAFYFGMNGTYDPKSHDELIALLTAELDPKPLEIALKFGYFFGTFGVPFEHYKPEDFGKGKIKGVSLEPTDGLKFKAINWLYHNKKFSAFSEKLRLRDREKNLQRFLQ
jgi:hypothetical protein